MVMGLSVRVRHTPSSGSTGLFLLEAGLLARSSKSGSSGSSSDSSDSSRPASKSRNVAQPQMQQAMAANYQNLLKVVMELMERQGKANKIDNTMMELTNRRDLFGMMGLQNKLARRGQQQTGLQPCTSLLCTTAVAPQAPQAMIPQAMPATYAPPLAQQPYVRMVQTAAPPVAPQMMPMMQAPPAMYAAAPMYAQPAPAAYAQPAVIVQSLGCAPDLSTHPACEDRIYEESYNTKIEVAQLILDERIRALKEKRNKLFAPSAWPS